MGAAVTVQLKGLSSGDIRAYYGGSVLISDRGIFKVETYEDRKFRGHFIRDGVWNPYACTPAKVKCVFPKEGYVLIEGNVHVLSQRIRRTRRKGFTSESYSLRPLSTSMDATSVVSLRNLPEVFKDELNKDYQKATERLKRKECRGYIFSKDLCIHKRSNVREVWLRGVKLGSIKKGGLELPKKFKVFQQELNEYNIPVVLV